MNVIFDNIQIKQTILSHLQQAKHSIEIAMAWFTDTDLAAALQPNKDAHACFSRKHACICQIRKGFKKLTHV